MSKLEEQGTHFVRWGAHDEDHPGVSIGCDNFQGGFDITQHLLSLGHQRFAFVGGADGSAPEFMARYLGHKEALKQANLQQYSQQIDAISTEDSGYVATQQLLDKNLELDAIVCASDLIAIGVLRALRDRKIAIPKQIAVVGYDNIQVASFANPSLTTVEQNTKLAGEILVDSLLKLICGEKVEHYLMPVDVVVRQSCGTVK